MRALSYSNLADLCDGKLGKHDVACPLCGPDRRDPANRKRRVLRIWHNEPGFASYSCARCGERGWARADGRDHAAVVRQHHRDDPVEDRDRERRVEIAADLWAASIPLTGTLGWRYFTERRGLHIGGLDDLSHALRWHEGVGAVIALMTDPASNKAVGIHRTFINPDGTKRERKMLGHQGVIRLSPDEEVTMGLGIAEGVEDALAVLLSGWAPMWAATSASAIKRFPVLSGSEALTVFADNDAAGLRAGQICAERWRAANREGSISPAKAYAHAS